MMKRLYGMSLALVLLCGTLAHGDLIFATYDGTNIGSSNLSLASSQRVGVRFVVPESADYNLTRVRLNIAMAFGDQTATRVRIYDLNETLPWQPGNVVATLIDPFVPIAFTGSNIDVFPNGNLTLHAGGTYFVVVDTDIPLTVSLSTNWRQGTIDPGLQYGYVYNYLDNGTEWSSYWGITSINPAIQIFADPVPGPATLTLLILGGGIVTRRRRA